MDRIVFRNDSVYGSIMHKEEFAEDMMTDEKLYFAKNVRQNFPEKLWYGVQVHIESGVH